MIEFGVPMSLATRAGLRSRFSAREERPMSAYLPYEANRVRLDDVLRQAEARRAAKRAPRDRVERLADQPVARRRLRLVPRFAH